MIRYSLKCANAHEFESWFQSAAAFEGLVRAAMVECPICGEHKVEKLLMAPAIRSGRNAPASPPEITEQTPPTLSKPDTDMAKALAALRAEVEATSEYVGNDFASEARRMHAGEAPERAIYGETKLQEAKQLLEEGVPVAPLPFMPRRKTN